MGFLTTWQLVNLKLLKENINSLKTLRDFLDSIIKFQDNSGVIQNYTPSGGNDMGFFLEFSDWTCYSNIYSEWKEKNTYQQNYGSGILKKYDIFDKKMSLSLTNQLKSVLFKIIRDTNSLNNSVINKSQLKLKKEGYNTSGIIMLSDNKLLALQILAKMARVEYDKNAQEARSIFKQSFLKYIDEKSTIENLILLSEMQFGKNDIFISKTI